jgi:hypothetical protein
MKTKNLVVATFLSLTAIEAHADVTCGSAPAMMNAPAGSLALQTSSGGPVSAILNAAGELRTHSLLVHGNGYITHSTMYQPQASSSFSCSSPIQAAMLHGAPGMEQINYGSLYAFTYGASGPGAGGSGNFGSVTEFFYQSGNGDGSNRGLQIANWAWDKVPYLDWGDGSYRLKAFDGSNPTTYSLYQYKDYQGMNLSPMPGIPLDQGSVCSTTQAFNQSHAGHGSIFNSAAGRGVWNNTYPHAIVNNALWAVWHAVNDACNSGLGFWDGVLSNTFGAIGCTRWSHDNCNWLFCYPVYEAPSTCELAADQVANCFATNRCSESDNHIWQGVANDGNQTATSISPDNLGGWQGFSYGAVAPNSVWSYDNQNQIYWNSPGNSYGCW